MKIGGFREEEWDGGLVSIYCCHLVLRVYMHYLPQVHRAGRQQDWNLEEASISPQASKSFIILRTSPSFLAMVSSQGHEPCLHPESWLILRDNTDTALPLLGGNSCSLPSQKGKGEGTQLCSTPLSRLSGPILQASIMLAEVRISP